MSEKLQIYHLLAFLTFFLIFGLLEHYFPLRNKDKNTKKRWSHNIGLSLINTISARFLFYITPVSVGLFIEEKSIGLFNIININFIIEIFLTIILLDFIIFVQHILSHKVKWIWELHKIHHSDKVLDVSTAIRFHTLEIILSLFIKIFFVVLLGLNPIAVVIFEIILVTSAMFNHSNIKIAQNIDKYLSLIIITPAFHQVHHSVIQKETDSNYGLFLSIWDKLCHTYTPHKFLVKNIGLNNTKKDLSIKDLILLDVDKK